MDPIEDVSPLYLSDSDIAEFQRLLKQETGADYTPDEAALRTRELIQLIRMLLKPPAENPGPSMPSTQRPARIAERLRGFSESLRFVRRRTDWFLVVRSAHVLLREVLISRLRRPGRTLGYEPLLEPLPRLLRDLQRLERPTLPDSAGKTTDRLHRLNRELNWITPGTWGILADELPRFFRDLLSLVRALVLPRADGTEPVPVPVPVEEQGSLERVLMEIEDQLLQHQAGRLKRPTMPTEDS
jgi:hypothetical protein